MKVMELNGTNKWVDGLLVVGIGLMTAGIGVGWKDRLKSEEIVVEKSEPRTVPVEERLIMVDIEGAVIKPGVKELKEGSRLSQALAEAGGLRAEADRGWVAQNINLAEVVRDQQKIYIPRVNEIKTSGTVVGNKAKISLNKAGKEELMNLDGVGSAMAERMVKYRNENGGFKTVEEVKLVSGVGEKLFERIKSSLEL